MKKEEFYDVLSVPTETTYIGEEIMAEVDTNQLSQEHADIRREGAEHTSDIRYDVATRAGDIRELIGRTSCETDTKVLERAGDIRREASEHTNEIVKEGIKSEAAVRNDIKDARYDLYSQIDRGFDKSGDHVENVKDTVLDRMFALGRDTMDLRAQVTSLGVTVRDNAQLSALQTEKAVLQNTIEGQKNTQYLSDKITNDGEKTRALLNDLKYHDLSRGLVERNTELVNCEQERRLYRDRWDDARFNQIQAGYQGQWAQLQSQIQAFQSQLQETRQGMVNFGTMAGVGQSSTSNNVR